jgi:hypothetical protein
MKAEFTYQRFDMVDAIRYDLFKRKKLWLVSVVGIALIILILVVFRDAIRVWPLLVASAFVTLLPFAVPFFCTLQFSKKAYSTLQAWKFLESGICVSTPDGRSDMNWSVFDSAELTANAILLYSSMNRYAFWIIPKRAFAEEGNLELLRQLLVSKSLLDGTAKG